MLTAGTAPAWPRGRPGAVPGPAAPDAAAAVTGLYRGHAVGLIRLALVMVGDRPAAEDIVQDAFTGLYRRWAHLADRGKALPYLRSSTINGCRNELRRRLRARRRPGEPVTDAASAEFAALVGEEHREVLAATRRSSCSARPAGGCCTAGSGAGRRPSATGPTAEPCCPGPRTAERSPSR